MNDYNNQEIQMIDILTFIMHTMIKHHRVP
jgi:hypothetical protein